MTPEAIILGWAACSAVVWFKVLHRNWDAYWAPYLAAILAIMGPLTLVYWAAPRSCTAAARALYRAICCITGERPR